MNEISIAQLHRHFISSTGVCIDTRKIQYGEMFFCIKGANFNANQFAEKALESGALFVIIDEKEYYIDSRTILVSDALETLQMLAAFHRKLYNIPVIGITGTNGKTTTKELVNAVLSKNFKTHATSGNFNNHIGVPLTLLSMPKDTELAIIEMGANHLGEIAELCRMSEPNYGIITSIGRAHLEGFGSLQGVIDTKTELYRFVEQSAGKVFVNADNELLMDLSKELDRITYGQNLKADIQAKLLNTTAFATAQWNGNTIQSQLVGAYNFDNMMAAIAMGKYFEITTEQIVEALQEYEPQNKRSQWQKTEKNELIIDAYNANPSSMEAALKSFESIEASNKWLILGDMLELGAESDAEHQKLVEQLLSHPEFKFILVGAEMLKAAKGKSVHAFADTTEAITWIDQHPINQSLILLKGSRGIALEKLIAYL